MTTLTAKQQRFVEEYTRDFNATRAAIRAGYSDRTAHSIGYELLRKPHVAAAIEERMERFAMSADEATARLSAIARGDIADLIEVLPNGAWKLDLERAVRDGKTWLIHELAYDRNGNPKLKMYSAHDALKDIGRIHGLFVERHEHTLLNFLKGLSPEEAEKLASLPDDELRQVLPPEFLK